MIFKSRKASLELSIRAIVIVVLAMTIMGLGLGFVRNTFKDIGGLSDDVTEQIRQQILDDLITSDKKVSFPKTELKIDKGGSEVLTVGIRNKDDFSLNYRMEFKAISGPSTINPFDDVQKGKVIDWFQFSTTSYELSSADSEVRNVRLSIPTSSKSGSYFLTFDIIKLIEDPSDPTKILEETYATKDFFIVVRG